MSDAVVAIETSTSTVDIVRQLLSLGKTHSLAYDITGVLHLKDGRLPFESTGVLLETGELSGLLNP